MSIYADQPQLSKEDESESGPDAEVTKEDQDKINSFSRLHNKERVLEEELQAKQVCNGFFVPWPLTAFSRTIKSAEPIYVSVAASLKDFHRKVFWWRTVKMVADVVLDIATER